MYGLRALCFGCLMMVASGVALAQQRTNDGRALDANSRVGSGGSNAPDTSTGSGPSGNNVVTGNVTNLKEFRGFVPYTDARAFRGPIAGKGVDNFIKNSAGPAAPYQPAANIYQTDAFYGRSLATPPPPGFAELGNTGTYVRTPTKPPPGSTIEDQRISLPAPAISNPPVDSGNLIMRGPIDPNTGQPTVVTGSPLYGLRQWRYDEIGAAGGLGLLDPRLASQLRQEQERRNDATTQPAGLLAGAMLSNDLPSRQVGATLTPDPLNNQVRADQGMESRMLAPPVQQSEQYAELRQRLEKYYEQRLKTEEGAQILAKVRPGEQPATQPGARTFGLPDFAQISRELVARATERGRSGSPQVQQPEPLKVQSLAKGVKSQAVADRLNRAEDLMRQGKFTSAMEQYDAAETLAPNNPLTWLGRAHAELGAGYYARSYFHLRQALLSDATLMMGRYDLKQMIGQERLNFLLADLKQLAVKDEKAPGPLVLLAYIAYNTGREEDASTWLAVAQKRAGAADPLVAAIYEHWKLPPSTQPANNK
jgi:tetratricopeptide (TPR) repeat protein